TAIDKPLAGQHAGLIAVCQTLVLAEHVADLAAADADIAGGHVRVFAKMAMKLRNERLAEAHDLAVGAAAGIEIGSALAAAYGKASERVLEDLLKAEKLDDPEIDRRMETDAALVGAERGIELNPEAAVDLHA